MNKIFIYIYIRSNYILILIILFFIFFYNYYIYNLISRVLFFQFPVATSRVPLLASCLRCHFLIYHLCQPPSFTHHFLHTPSFSLAEGDVAAMLARQWPELVLQKMLACLFVTIPGVTAAARWLYLHFLW